jgi:cell wall-associated NlpC family hydrolase
MRRDPTAARRFAHGTRHAGQPVLVGPGSLALAGTLLATLLVVGGPAPTAAAPLAGQASAQQGQGADQLRAEAEKALARWDAHRATIEDAAEQVNAVAGHVQGLQAKIAELQEHRRAVGKELVGAESGSDTDPLAGVRSVAARFFNSFATGLSGGLGGSGDRRDYGPVLFDLPETIDRRQRQRTQLEAQQRTLDALYGRLESDRKRTPAEVRKLADRLAKRRERQRRDAYKAWAEGVKDQYGAVKSGPLQPGEAAVAAVRFALAQLGRPYQWGATGPGTYDCSGLTSTAYRQVGLAIPRVSRDQAGFGEPVAFNNLVPGDLVFFGNPVHHVGMYYQGGLMVHAPHTGDVVRVASIWRRGYAGARRPITAIGGTGTNLPMVPPLPPPAAISTPERKAAVPGTSVTSTTGTSATTSTTTVPTPPSTQTTGPPVVTDTTGPEPATTTGPTSTQAAEPPATSSGSSEQSGAAPETAAQASASARDPP